MWLIRVFVANVEADSDQLSNKTEQSQIVYFEIRNKFVTNIIPIAKRWTFLLSTGYSVGKEEAEESEQTSEPELGKKRNHRRKVFLVLSLLLYPTLFLLDNKQN